MKKIIMGGNDIRVFLVEQGVGWEKVEQAESLQTSLMARPCFPPPDGGGTQSILVY